MFAGLLYMQQSSIVADFGVGNMGLRTCGHRTFEICIHVDQKFYQLSVNTRIQWHTELQCGAMEIIDQGGISHICRFLALIIKPWFSFDALYYSLYVQNAPAPFDNWLIQIRWPRRKCMLSKSMLTRFYCSIEFSMHHAQVHLNSSIL